MSFPVINYNVGLEQHFAQYSKPRNQMGLTSNQTVPINTDIGSGGQAVGQCTLNSKEMFYAKSITISCNRDVRARIVFQVRSGAYPGAGGLGAETGSTSFQIKSGIPAVIPINTVLCGSLISSIDLRISRNFSDNADGVYSEINLLGYSMYEDVDFVCDDKILCVGDSIMLGYTGSTRKDGHFLWMFKNYLSGKGNRCQIINEAVSGSTSQSVRAFMSNGLFSYVPNASFILENHGANDVGQNTTPENFQLYLDELCAWKQSLYPNATLILFGGTTLQNTASNTAGNVFRNLKRDKVASINDPKILYCDLNVIQNPVNADYVPTDTSGSGIHINDQGNQKVWDNGLLPFLEENF